MTMSLSLTFGLILTWVERKQAAVMADRIGANRAYVRIPFTQVKLVAWGLFHGIADGIKMLVSHWYHLPTLWSLLFIAVVLTLVQVAPRSCEVQTAGPNHSLPPAAWIAPVAGSRMA